MKTHLLEAATNILLDIHESTIVLPFATKTVINSNDDEAVLKAEKIALAQAKKLATKFNIKIGDSDFDGDDFQIQFKGDDRKLAAAIKAHMGDDEDMTDSELIKTYIEETQIEEAEELTYSKHSPVAKLKRLRAMVKTIPSNKFDYVLKIIAAHASNEQIDEIIAGLEKP